MERGNLSLTGRWRLPPAPSRVIFATCNDKRTILFPANAQGECGEDQVAGLPYQRESHRKGSGAMEDRILIRPVLLYWDGLIGHPQV
jgi:hypothetical protein